MTEERLKYIEGRIKDFRDMKETALSLSLCSMGVIEELTAEIRRCWGREAEWQKMYDKDIGLTKEEQERLDTPPKKE